MALPFADSSFDLIACQFGVMFFPGKDKAYRDAIRVLAPGGRYLFSIRDTHRHNSFARIAHSTAASFFPGNPPQFQTLPCSYRFDSIKGSMIEAGFCKIGASVLRMEKDVPDVAPLSAALSMAARSSMKSRRATVSVQKMSSAPWRRSSNANSA